MGVAKSRTRLGIQTTQGNRLSCRDQEGRMGSEEAVPGPSVFPLGEPGVSGDFWGSQEGCQGRGHSLWAKDTPILKQLVNQSSP